MSTVVHLDRKSDFHDLISKHKDVIVLFFTNWCYYCHVMRPNFEYVSGLATLNGLTFGGVLCDVNDWDYDAQKEVGIDCYPTIQVYRNRERFGYMEGGHDNEELESWLKTYLILSRSSPHLEKGVPKGLALPPIDMAVSRARGKDPMLDISIWTGPQFEKFISQHKHVIVGLHSTNTPHGMSFCFKRAAKSSKFKDVQFLRVDCDVEQSDSAEILRELLWLRFRPVMWMFRDGRLFSKLTDVIQGATFANWLDDCLSASAGTSLSIADSAPINVEDYLSGGEEQDESENGDEEEENTTESEPVEDARANPEEQLEAEEEGFQPPSEGPPVEEEVVVAEGASDQDAADAGDEEAVGAGGEEAKGAVDEEPEDEQEPEEESICTHLATIRNADVRNCHSERVTEITSLEEFNAQISEDTVSVSVFYDGHDHYTQAMTLVLLYIADLPSYSHMKFSKVDCVQHPDIAQEVCIEKSHCPQTMVFCDNKQLAERHGAVDSAEFEDWLRPFVPIKHADHSQEDLQPNTTAILTITVTAEPEEMDEESFSDTAVTDVQTAPLSSDSTIYLRSTSSLPIKGVRCEGRHLDRPYRHRWMNWPHKRRSFHDPEYDCYFVPTDSDGHGLEIGRANEGDSYFNMTLIQGPDTDPGKVSFGVGFGPDSTVKARFESAVIRVEFGYDGDVEGRSFPLRIKDIHPKDDEGQSTEVVFGKESNISLGLSVGPGSAASLSSSGGYSQNKQYTRKTAARVRGQGVHSSSAEWTFVEDVGEAGRQGLDPQYELFATLPTTQRTIWIKFWAKAILKRKDGFGWGNEVILKLGSKEEPYRRNIDLLGWLDE
ncbi:uncharacterized protein ARMOST_06536 [Armillaria ostoyae]|uniref:Thioredoxin domain-containing protein n=1 Tax=Armillaria ostoyae TaxID=47428 RepID=A0A284R394_ARMOS|nr:uncharacterized protein ARMOST_06536 [Armillaria ostoyae]